MKMQYMPDKIMENYDELLRFTGIDLLKRRMDTEIIAKYRELLIEDIKGNYELCKENIRDVIEKIKAKQKEIIDISTKSIEEIHAAQEEGRKKLADIQKDQAELVELVGEIKRQTGERTRQLEQAIRGLAR